MEKRYQVFVSSTYADLKDERQRIIQMLMEMDCIPTGMELFPAADEEQWKFIKRVIDDCDYYLLIIGGRHGSLTTDGISYTEKEYDYAVERGIKVIALLRDPDEIPTDKLENDPTAHEKLKQFREKVSNGRLIKPWRNAEDLPGLVNISLQKTMKASPAIGWIRANTLPSESLVIELNELRKENQNLRERIWKSQEFERVPVDDLATLDEKIQVGGTHTVNRIWSLTITWKEIFGLLAPYLLENPNDTLLKSRLEISLFELSGVSGYSPHLNDQVFQSIKLQLTAHKLVNVQNLQTTQGGYALFWSLTPQGQALMMELRTVRKKDT